MENRAKTVQMDEPAALNPVRATVETIAELHRRHVSQVDSSQRGIERLTANLSQPLMLFTTICLVVFWVGGNVLTRILGHTPADKAPFFWLQGAICLMSLLLTGLVLITQNRQDRSAERRSQLDLQVSILVDQKVTKLINLVEELRRDLPNVRNRRDIEAEKLSEASDIANVVDELNELLDQVEQTPEQDLRKGI